MKLDPDEFCVAPGKTVDAGKWPTYVMPLYKSKARYKHLLAEHVEQFHLPAPTSVAGSITVSCLSSSALGERMV